MIQCQLKLRLTRNQELHLEDMLNTLTGVWNWAIRKIELDAKDGIYYSAFEFQNLLAGHGKRIDVPGHTLQLMLADAFIAWKRCFKKISGRPRLKGVRNKLNSIPFHGTWNLTDATHIRIHNKLIVRFYRQEIPEGKIQMGRIIRRASGWYLCLFIKAEPRSIPVVSDNQIGIDPGYESLLTFSDGTKIEPPREFVAAQIRIGQAQRGHNKKLAARIQERVRNRRKDRNHKISRELVSKNAFIAFSADSHGKLAQLGHGKSVGDSGHRQLRSMLAYKSSSCGRTYVEPSSVNSTRRCSCCGQLTGPTGEEGLKVRRWRCSNCGTLHDRDVNSAINTLIAGLGSSLGDRNPQEIGGGQIQEEVHVENHRHPHFRRLRKSRSPRGSNSRRIHC